MSVVRSMHTGLLSHLHALCFHAHHVHDGSKVEGCFLRCNDCKALPKSTLRSCVCDAVCLHGLRKCAKSSYGR